MTTVIDKPDNKEITLKVSKLKSGMKYKDKEYYFYRVNAIPNNVIDNYSKGYFEIKDNEIKLFVFENENIIFSLERRRKQSAILSEENFKQRREIKDWKERFENVQKTSLKLTSKIAEGNRKMKELGIDYRIDPFDI